MTRSGTPLMISPAELPGSATDRESRQPEAPRADASPAILSDADVGALLEQGAPSDLMRRPEDDVPDVEQLARLAVLEAARDGECACDDDSTRFPFGSEAPGASYRYAIDL